MRREERPRVWAAGLLVLPANGLADTADVLERVDRDADIADPRVHELFLRAQRGAHVGYVRVRLAVARARTPPVEAGRPVAGESGAHHEAVVEVVCNLLCWSFCCEF